MREFIDDEGERHIDPFCFDEFGMIDRGVKAIRFLYGVTGAVGLIGGAALLIWPVKTLVVLAVILGAFSILSGVVSSVAGIAVFMFPLESVDLMIVFSGIALAVLGGVLLARAFTFGKISR